MKKYDIYNKHIHVAATDIATNENEITTIFYSIKNIDLHDDKYEELVRNLINDNRLIDDKKIPISDVVKNKITVAAEYDKESDKTVEDFAKTAVLYDPMCNKIQINNKVLIAMTADNVNYNIEYKYHFSIATGKNRKKND